MTSIQRRTLLGGALAGLAVPALDRRAKVAGLPGLCAATPVVALSEGVHDLQESWDYLAVAMFQPGFDAIVIELGNSRYQDVADEYVSGGLVRKSDLQHIWRDTTQSPLATGDVPVLFRLLSLARAINLFTARSLRVLLADPPIDWTRIRSRADLDPFMLQRNESWAGVIVREVLDHGLRCVTIGGGAHLYRGQPSTVPALIEREHPGTVSVVHTHSVATTAEVERCVAGWHTPSIADTRRVAYGRLPATAIQADVPRGLDVTGLTVADLADYVLFLGHRRDLTRAVPDWEIFYEPAYWAELNRRKEVTGFPGDLSVLRQEADPAMFPEER
jgi:hypothetical protein